MLVAGGFVHLITTRATSALSTTSAVVAITVWAAPMVLHLDLASRLDYNKRIILT